MAETKSSSEQRTARETLEKRQEMAFRLERLANVKQQHADSNRRTDIGKAHMLDDDAEALLAGAASLRAAPVPTDGPVTPEEIEAATVARPFPYNAVHAPSPFRVSDGRFSAEQRMGWHLVNDAGFTVGVLCDRSFFDSMAICWTAAEVMARRADRLVEKLEQRAAPAPEGETPPTFVPPPAQGEQWSCPCGLLQRGNTCEKCGRGRGHALTGAAPASPAPAPEGETPFMCDHGRCRQTCEECAPAAPAPTPEGRKPTGPDLALAQTVLHNQAIREAKADVLRDLIAYGERNPGRFVSVEAMQAKLAELSGKIAE